jgi:hypothetical protein
MQILVQIEAKYRVNAPLLAVGFIPAKQRAKRELARIWRLPRGSNTPPLWGELAKKKLSHAPLLAAGYLTLGGD